MLRKYLGTLILIACILVASFTLFACDSDDEDMGELPVLMMGDTWTTNGSMAGSDVTVILTVTGDEVVEGKAAYVLEGTINPALEGIVDTIVMKLDKSSMLPLEMQMMGESDGDPFEITTTSSYDITGAPKYPKELGNQTTVIATQTTVTKTLGQLETEMTETETTTSVYKVEGIEDITVPAGTFTCFKEVEYDEAGVVLNTDWQSAATKHFNVKSIDGETGDVMELVSYSVIP